MSEARGARSVTADEPAAGLQAAAGLVRVVPRTARVALLGLGTVGGGVLALLSRNRAHIERRVGRGIEVVAVLVRDPDRPRPVVPLDIVTTDARRVLEDSQVEVVVEVMGGIHPALEYASAALRAGRSVVTANKDMLSEHGAELWAAAAAGRSDLFFEASVGGGIPIVRALKESLAANRIRRIAGVLNGTTNYILTRMTRDRLSQDEALRQAQSLGFAEADPRADLDGVDAARKLAILSSIAYNSRCLPRDVFCQGIRDVSAADIAHAERLGWVVKLLAVSEMRDDRVSMRVHPTFVPSTHPLAAVNDAFNAIYVQGDAVGEAMFLGHGAGAEPTASAVVGDLMEAVRSAPRGGAGTGCTCFMQRPMLPLPEVRSRFYLRLRVVDRVGVLAQIAGIFGRCGVSILSVLQSPLPDPRPAEEAELILVTHEVAEDRMAAAVKGVAGLAVVAAVGALIRLAPEDL